MSNDFFGKIMNESSIVYRCEFIFKEEICVVYSQFLEDFKDGFWLNDDRNFTKGSDARYWIPPHSIEYVAKDVMNRPS